MTMDEITLELDQSARIFTVHVVGNVTNAQALRDISRVWEEHPEVSGYDSIIDLTHDHRSITWDTVAEIEDRRRAFVGAANPGCRTAVVVRNALWKTIVSVIRWRFPEGHFRAFKSINDARRWMAD